MMTQCCLIPLRLLCGKCCGANARLRKSGVSLFYHRKFYFCAWIWFQFMKQKGQRWSTDKKTQRGHDLLMKLLLKMIPSCEFHNTNGRRTALWSSESLNHSKGNAFNLSKLIRTCMGSSTQRGKISDHGIHRECAEVVAAHLEGSWRVSSRMLLIC